MKSLVVLNECLFSDSQIKGLNKHFKDVLLYDNTSTQRAAIERIGNHNIVVMDQFKLEITENILEHCKDLELIILNTTAYDRMDLKLLQSYGVRLAAVPKYATQDVAEVAIGMMFELNNHSRYAQDLATGLFSSDVDVERVHDIWPGHPSSAKVIRHQLRGQTIGIFGFGAIGRVCAQRCLSLGMNVIAYNRTEVRASGVRFVTPKVLFQEANILLISMAYQPGLNDKIIDKQLLDLAQDRALLLSVSHPALIDQAYLLAHHRKFRGIGFDYLVTPDVLKLMNSRTDDLIVTPHLGSQSFEAISNMTESIIDIAKSFSDNLDHHGFI